jgi:hypothetical protein
MVLRPVDQLGGGGGAHRIVFAVGRALEAARCVAREGPRDHARDFVGLHEIERDSAQIEQPFEAEMDFVRRNLEHAVGRGVDDGFARRDVLEPEIVDDPRAGGVAATEHARQLRPRDKVGNQSGRKARHGLREIAPFEFDGHTRHFPMARRRVLAERTLARGSVPALRGRAAVTRVGRGRVGGVEAEAHEIGHVRFVRGTDMAPRVGPHVAEARRVGCGTDAERVHDQHESARHRQAPKVSRTTAPETPRVGPIR